MSGKFRLWQLLESCYKIGMPITKKDLDALGGGGLIWDRGRGSVSGFGARCQKTAKVFVLKYSFEGSQRWHSIGRFGSPWTVDGARSEAKRLLGKIASGEDPSRSRHTNNGPHERLSDFCDRYMHAARAGVILTRFRRPKRTAPLQIDQGRIDRHIKPLIGNLRLVDLNRTVVRQFINDITVGKTVTDLRTGARGRAIVRGGAGTAARVADLLSGIMSWAVEQGFLAHNPVHGVRRFRGEPRDRFLLSDEIVSFGRELAAREKYNPTAISIVKLLALTGCRLNEIAGLAWSEVDLENSCLRLATTKTGRSMRPLGKAAAKVLRGIPRHQNCDFVFPSARLTGAYQGTKREIKRMFESAGIPSASSHTLRHTFASIASELGYSDATIKLDFWVTKPGR
jgi:integrase